MSKQAELFKNRIIGYGTKAADQFEANPLNYRKHPQRQRDAVQASLRELGWIGVVVENKRTGRLIDGHERVWQALQNNEDVPYIEVDLTEDEERLALAVFDPITGMAETDAAILDELLREVNTGEAALQALLGELANTAALYGDEGGLYVSDQQSPEQARATLAERFLIPPFSVLDARQGYWQARKSAWIALGIQSELGRGENIVPNGSERPREQDGAWMRHTRSNAPGGSPRDAATLKNGRTVRGDGTGKPLSRGGVSMAMHNDPMQRKAKYDAG